MHYLPDKKLRHDRFPGLAGKVVNLAQSAVAAEYTDCFSAKG